MTERAKLLEARGVRKSYRSGGGRLDVLRGVDFDLEPGGFVSVIGQSGSGKSTLLHLMGLLDAPDAVRPPFNDQARLAAGFTPAELKQLAARAGRPRSA